MIFRILALILCLIPTPALALTFAWDASPSPEVTGYRIYSGMASRTYDRAWDVGNTLTATLAVETQSPGTYYFAVTAYDATGLESDYSNEVSYTVYPAPPPPPPPPPQPPPNFHITASVNNSTKGFISPSGDVAVIAGDSQTFLIGTYGRSKINKVFVDGRSVGPVAGYVFGNVQADHTIQVNLK